MQDGYGLCEGDCDLNTAIIVVQQSISNEGSRRRPKKLVFVLNQGEPAKNTLCPLRPCHNHLRETAARWGNRKIRLFAGLYHLRRFWWARGFFCIEKQSKKLFPPASKGAKEGAWKIEMSRELLRADQNRAHVTATEL